MDRVSDGYMKNESGSHSGLAIEGFSPALAGAFRSINEEWIREYFVLEAADRKSMDDPVASIIAPGGEILFVRDSNSGEILGTCALVNHGDGVAELAKMGVTRLARGRGAGLLLVRGIIGRARAMGFRRLFLETNSILLPALKIYQQVGFVTLPAPRNSDYQRADVYMELPLD
jgi:GNAT superfamily N-acetyltransferase